MELMRIALFYNLNFGGAKRTVFEQTNRLKKKGHTVDIYTIDSSEDIFNLSSVASNFYKYNYSPYLKIFPFVSRFFNDFKTFFVLNSLHRKISHDIDKRKYGIVLVHPDKLTQAPFVLRHLKTRSVYYCQEPLRIVYEYNLRANKSLEIVKYIYEQVTRIIRKKIDLDNVRSATFTLASCYHIRERMIECYGVYPRISYLGIDEKIFRPVSVERKNQIFFIGNKEVINDGYDLVNNAIKALPGKYKVSLKCISWVKENDRRLSDESLVREYSSSLAVVCPNRLETFGLVPLEAMACGVPVIATNVGGHRETIINGKTGFLTDFNSLEIRDKISDLIKNPGFTEKIGKEGRRHIEKHWTWDKRILELEVLLNEFINEK